MTDKKLRDDLQTQREVAAHNMNRNAREYKRVCDENAKLRELVQEAIYARDDADWASIVSTAIALGIEVK